MPLQQGLKGVLLKRLESLFSFRVFLVKRNCS